MTDNICFETLARVMTENGVATTVTRAGHLRIETHDRPIRVELRDGCYYYCPQSASYYTNIWWVLRAAVQVGFSREVGHQRLDALERVKAHFDVSA
jgi:hypothetical protein